MCILTEVDIYRYYYYIRALNDYDKFARTNALALNNHCSFSSSFIPLTSAFRGPSSCFIASRFIIASIIYIIDFNYVFIR